MKTVRMRMPSLIRVRSGVHFSTGTGEPGMVLNAGSQHLGERFLKTVPPGRG